MRTIVIIIGFIVCSGCSSELDLAPIDARSEATYWQTEEDARIFLNSIYADIFNADTYLFLSALSDDAYSRSREDYRNIASGNYDSSNGVISGIWSGRYEGIRRANIFFNNIDRVQDITDETRTSLMAQAHFIRAWHYFLLIELYGDVPLITSEISIEESLALERTDANEVLAFVYSELQQAIDNLPESYPSDQQGRITRGAALALKSRIHLYNEEYTEAIALLEELIGAYSLFTDYGALFQMDNEYNEEIILSLQYVPTDREHNIQYSLIPPSLGGYAAFCPLQNLIESFPTINGREIDDPISNFDGDSPFINRDPRLAASIIYDEYTMIDFNGSPITIDTSPGAAPDGLNYSSNATPTGYYVSKFYDNEARNQTNSGLNLILIRYGEVLLNYAEAKIETGQFTEEDWNLTIAALRSRAGLTQEALQFPGNNQDNLRTIVRNERRIELVFEAGHRFFDIRRWRTAEDVLNGWVYGMTTDEAGEEGVRVESRTFETNKHYLWPIPLRERDINNNLTQNPNW